MISMTTEMLFIGYSKIILQFFLLLLPRVSNFALILGNFWVPKSWPFLPFLMDFIFSSSLNTHYIFKVLLWNWKLIMIDILTSPSSNMTAPTLYTLYTKCMCWIILDFISMTVIKEAKNHFSLKSLTFYETNLTTLFFFFFTCTTKNHIGTTKWPKVEPTQSQTCWSIRDYFFIKRNTDVNTGDLKILFKEMSK